MSQRLRRLAIAVSTGRVAAVFMEGDQVVATKMSRAAAKTSQNAARIVQSWITGFRPDHLIMEDPDTALRKGAHVKSILQAISRTYEVSDGLDIRLSRIQSYQNKYEEAKALAEAFPEAAHLLTQQPPIWMPEPRNMSYFEALSFVAQLKD